MKKAERKARAGRFEEVAWDWTLADCMAMVARQGIDGAKFHQSARNDGWVAVVEVRS